MLFDLGVKSDIFRDGKHGYAEDRHRQIPLLSYQSRSARAIFPFDNIRLLLTGDAGGRIVAQRGKRPGRGTMETKVKAWTIGDKAMPHFPSEFEIVRKVVLQVTNIQNNNNKYYALELHQAKEKGRTLFRLFTHYGRTDDLEKNPESGQKENRFFDTLAEAQQAYDSIYREKTSPRKGYKEVSRNSPASSTRSFPTASGAPAGPSPQPSSIRWPPSSRSRNCCN
jgi:predicted DNA-binding WGR domain protein